DLIDFQQVALGIRLETGTDQLVENFFGTVEQASLQIILAQLRQGVQADTILEITAIDQILVHADGTFGFAPPAEQVTEGEVQFDGLRIDLGDLQKGID